MSGHVGYGIVPWKRRRGYATQALRLLLPVAAQVTGLRRVSLTCDTDNAASCAVIEANGGVRDGAPRQGKLHYFITLPPVAT